MFINEVIMSYALKHSLFLAGKLTLAGLRQVYRDINDPFSSPPQKFMRTILAPVTFLGGFCGTAAEIALRGESNLDAPDRPAALHRSRGTSAPKGLVS